jgi:hypothetical protein
MVASGAGSLSDHNLRIMRENFVRPGGHAGNGVHADSTLIDPAPPSAVPSGTVCLFAIVIRWFRSLMLPSPTGYHPLSLRDKRIL